MFENRDYFSCEPYIIKNSKFWVTNLETTEKEDFLVDIFRSFRKDIVAEAIIPLNKEELKKSFKINIDIIIFKFYDYFYVTELSSLKTLVQENDIEIIDIIYKDDK